MSPGLGRRSTVLLVTALLVAVAVVVPTAAGAVANIGSAEVGGQLAADRTGDAVLSLEGSADARGAETRVQSPTAAGTIGDRLAAATDRVATIDWGPPLAVLLFGYTRQADEAPLDNEVRERVYEQVRSTPGAHIAGIVDVTDVARSTVRYHLRVLESAGLVAGATVRGRHRYAPAGEDLELAAALYDEPTRAVLEAVARFEPVSPSGLAEEVGRAPSTVSHHLDGLEAAGLLSRDRTDGRLVVRLEDAAAVDVVQRRPPAAAEQGSLAELSTD